MDVNLWITILLTAIVTAITTSYFSYRYAKKAFREEKAFEEDEKRRDELRNIRGEIYPEILQGLSNDWLREGEETYENKRRLDFLKSRLSIAMTMFLGDDKVRKALISMKFLIEYRPNSEEVKALNYKSILDADKKTLDTAIIDLERKLTE